MGYQVPFHRLRTIVCLFFFFFASLIFFAFREKKKKERKVSVPNANRKIFQVIYLHGGPGGSTSPSNAQFFDPAVYRVVLMDQRGVGKSRPRNELRENTTQHLADDIERLRAHLGVEKWHVVFGGSWGSTLGLFYAQAHPERVGALVLRGIFTARRSELLVEGAPVARLFFPQEWEAFLNYLPEEERGDYITAYHKRITSDDKEVAYAAAYQWSKWDLNMGTLRPDPWTAQMLEQPDWCFTHSLFESHYLFQNAAWLEDGQLLAPANMEKIKHITGKFPGLETCGPHRRNH